MLDEAIQDEAAYAERGSRMRPPMLDEAIQDEALLVLTFCNL